MINLTTCRRYGEMAAVRSWTPAELAAFIVELGAGPLTRARIERAYREQLARA